MIAWLNRQVSGALMLREATRTARRGSFYLTRAGFSAITFGVLFLILQSLVYQDLVNISNIAWLNRALFITVSVAQIGFITVFAPLLAAQAIIEERTLKTLPLLLLTPLTSGQIYRALIGSRILWMLMVILGGLPLLSLLTSLGGVSITELLTLTLHTLLGTILLASVGGFFGLHCHSPLMATALSWFFALPVFALFPALYSLFVGSTSAPAHVSPLYVTTAEGPLVLLAVPLYLGLFTFIQWISARQFERVASGAHRIRLYDRTLWGARPFLYTLLLWLLYSLIGLPIAVICNWIFISGAYFTTKNPILQSLPVFAVFLWYALSLLLYTWVFLRMGLDVATILDALVGPKGARRVVNGGARVGRFPMLWREVNLRAWRLYLPGAFGWIVLIILVLQSGIWIIPGGLFLIAGLHLWLTLMLSVWMATRAIHQERVARTLPLLLLSKLPTWRILLAKSLGVLLPTSLLMLIGLPMLAGGASFFLFFGSLSTENHVVLSILLLWFFPMQLSLIALSMIGALHVPNGKSPYLRNLLMANALLLLPLTQFLPGPLGWPGRLLFPLHPAHWTYLSLAATSGLILTLMSGSTLVLLYRFRQWAVRHD